MKNSTTRVATYNIWHGQIVLDDIEIIGRELLHLGADIVGLQEVDQNTSRVGGRDTLSLIAKAGEYPYYAFTHAFDYEGGGAYGTAVLSRYPIRSFEVIPLSSPGVEPRSVGHAVIEVGDTCIDFFNTHLSVEDRSICRDQILALREMVLRCQNVIVTGDFNTEEAEDLALLAPLPTVNPGNLFSYYSGKRAIDHIFYSDAFSCEEVEMPQLPHSDHYPIVARFSF